MNWIDLVENLDVEHAANTMKCPTRVEICSCAWKENQSQDNTMGIKNGYKYIYTLLVSVNRLRSKVANTFTSFLYILPLR